MDVSINGARILATIENVPLFGSVQITQTLTASWLVMLIISGLLIWLGSGLKVSGISRKQAVAEMAYTSLVNFVRGNMGIGFDHYIPWWEPFSSPASSPISSVCWASGAPRLI